MVRKPSRGSESDTKSVRSYKSGKSSKQQNTGKDSKNYDQGSQRTMDEGKRNLSRVNTRRDNFCSFIWNTGTEVQRDDQLTGMIRIVIQMVIRIFQILKRDENTTILVLFGRCKTHLICGKKNEKSLETIKNN